MFPLTSCSYSRISDSLHFHRILHLLNPVILLPYHVQVLVIVHLLPSVRLLKSIPGILQFLKTELVFEVDFTKVVVLCVVFVTVDLQIAVLVEELRVISSGLKDLFGNKLYSSKECGWSSLPFSEYDNNSFTLRLSLRISSS